MSITYKIQGLDAFLSTVQDKPVKAQQAVRAELNRAALRVEKSAKEFAPWDTGTLINNIYSTQLGSLLFGVISPMNYSIYVELGTRKMAAQPFMYPAVQLEAPRVLGNLRKMFGE